MRNSASRSLYAISRFVNFVLTTYKITNLRPPRVILVDSGDTTILPSAPLRSQYGPPESPMRLWLVEDVLRSNTIPFSLINEFPDQFGAIKEYGRSLGKGYRSRYILESLLGHIAANMFPLPRFHQLVLLDFDRYRSVHLLHSLLYVLSET